ncbi:MAG: 7-cyano-7-deazaguanine synthase QueC [Gammaproteobacteria bacterium]|nr:7-cyano-7-deazaguanine synthase QueC [Gammaproteobacteria bacterium]
MKKAVVLLSGGLDSLTCLVIAQSQGYEVHAISFDYGQKHRSELVAAKKITERYNAKHKIIEMHALGKLGGSALTDDSISVKDFKGDDKIPETYVPARNIVFLSIALGFAEIIDAEAVFIGANAIDYSGYPDCRPEFIEAFRKVADTGTKAGVEGQAIKILAPIIDLTKSEIIQLGTTLGAEYGLSVSCYRADEKGHACGECDSCHFRKQGFIEAEFPDPTRYIVK